MAFTINRPNAERDVSSPPLSDANSTISSKQSSHHRRIAPMFPISHAHSFLSRAMLGRGGSLVLSSREWPWAWYGTTPRSGFEPSAPKQSVSVGGRFGKLQ